MTWAQKAAAEAEREKQREADAKKEAERKDKQESAQRHALGAKLSPMVTKVLDEAGEAVFGRGALVGAKKYKVKDSKLHWTLEPTQGLETTTFIVHDDDLGSSPTKYKNFDFYSIEVYLQPVSAGSNEYCFSVRQVKRTETSSKFGRHSNTNRGHEIMTKDISEEALIAPLKDFIVTIKTVILEHQKRRRL